MKSLNKQIKEVLKKEEKKNSKTEEFKEVEKLIDSLDKLGISKKPTYDLPQVDTIGKNYYSASKIRN